MTIEEINETKTLTSLLGVGSDNSILLLSLISLPLNLLVICVIAKGSRKPEVAIDMLLLAIADILLVMPPWLMFLFLEIGLNSKKCDIKFLWRIYEVHSVFTSLTFTFYWF